ncbi:MAG TPA: hypothetical protein VHA35_20530 [Dongiaceae bacterium]|jgi:hypothetical protein|nr:hypothetical protein [Dongiaceae bacterium]
MTVPTSINREQYATDGVTTVFTIHFPFFDDTDVNAIFVDAGGSATTLTLSTDFSVGGGNGAGGTLTTSTALAAGGTLTVFRDVAYTQEDDYVENDPLPAATLESGFDRAAMRDQQLKDAVDRAMRFPPTIDPGVSAVLPSPAADQLLGWTGDGNALENKSLPSGSAVYGSVANTRIGVSSAEAVTPASLAALWKKGADIASAATLAKPSDPNLGGYHAVGGTTTIQFFWSGEANGCPLELCFDGVLTLTHGASGAGHLYLPGLADITTAVGDSAGFRYETASQRWRCTRYTRADGTALVAPPPVNTAGALLSLFNNCI